MTDFEVPPLGIHPGEAITLTDMFLRQAERLADRAFLHHWDGEGSQTLTWAEARERTLRLAAGLKALGVAPGDRVLLVAENRPEWLIADCAIMAAGAITVPAYTTNTAEDHLHVLNDSGAVAAIVSTAKLAQNLMPAAARADACRHVIALEPVADAPAQGFALHAWDEIASAAPMDPHDAARTDTACIIYTSGTGGAPKGVMLSHGAVLCNCAGAQYLFRNAKLGEERFLSFLPLSHSYEHTAGQFLPISIGAEIYYAEGIDTLARDMVSARPTIMTAVPRLYESMQGRILQGLRRAKPIQRKLFETTLALGEKRYERGTLPVHERILDAVLERLVRAKVRGRFGGSLRFLVSGGAPLNPEVGRFFIALGINILQGYGQTETAPVVSCNPPENIRIQTVGPPFPDVEVRIADDGEILVRGELVMQGYWNNADATNEAIRDGWLHTGDVGHIDEQGYLHITDRKKDIIVNSGGDNISPQRVEGFLTMEPEIAQAMVYGDKRPHLVALIVPDEAAVREWAGSNGQKEAGFADIVASAGFKAHIGDVVERVNRNLAAIERVRRFILTAEPFTTGNGQMTPTLKVRRHVLKEVYGTGLEALYRG